MGRLARLLGGKAPARRMLDGFVDSLLQTFENSRAGLTDEMLRAGSVEGFFLDLYEKDVPRLREHVGRLQHLGAYDRDELFERVDERIRRVVLPAYTRLAKDFTPRERNDFYLTPLSAHGLERVGFGAVGLALGAFVVWAPFIPLYAKEWVLVFGIGGLVFPSLRRFVALRHYQSQLDDLVARTDDEIWRLDLSFMTKAADRAPDVGEPDLAEAGPEGTALLERLRSAPREAHPEGRGPISPGAGKEKAR